MKIILTFFLLILLTSCNKDKNNCVEHVTLEEVFTVKSNCTYRFEKNNTTINLCLADIDDGRSFGGECAASWGGGARVKLTANKDTLEFIWRGCDTETEYSIDHPDLPVEEVDSYRIKMMKMYPLSKDLNEPPESIDDYKLKFVILK